MARGVLGPPLQGIYPGMVPYTPRYPGAYEQQQQQHFIAQQQFLMHQMMASSQVRTHPSLLSYAVYIASLTVPVAQAR